MSQQNTVIPGKWAKLGGRGQFEYLRLEIAKDGGEGLVVNLSANRTSKLDDQPLSEIPVIVHQLKIIPHGVKYFRLFHMDFIHAAEDVVLGAVRIVLRERKQIIGPIQIVVCMLGFPCIQINPA